MSKIVILDRDGVINHDSVNYIKSPDEWHPIKGSLEAIAHLHKAGYVIVIATNQSGLARNLFSVSTLDAIHKKMSDTVESHGGYLTHIFYCPHHPDADCNCRKPRTGLLTQISEFLKADLLDAPFIGDSLTDMVAAKNYGCRPVLVKTGNGSRTKTELTAPYPDIFEDLYAATLSLIHRGA